MCSWRRPFFFFSALLLHGFSSLHPHAVTAAEMPKKTAYVTVFHHLGSSSNVPDLLFLGVQVLLGTLREHEESMDIIVLVSSGVTLEQRDRLQELGATLVTVPDISHSCKYEFSVLHAWNLLQYDRVLFLSPDTVVLKSLRELFHCGHFCIPYNSWHLFTTDLILLKPSRIKFTQLTTALTATELHPEDVGIEKVFISDMLSCQDLAYQFMLNAFFYMENAPLFVENGQSSDEPMMRLSIGYSMNAMVYNEHFDFELFRVGRLKNEPVPANSLSFPGVKPWYWTTALYFDMHWFWHAQRARVLQESHTWFLISRAFALLALIVAVQVVAIDRYFSRCKLSPAVLSWLVKLFALVGVSTSPFFPSSSSFSSSSSSTSAEASVQLDGAQASTTSRRWEQALVGGGNSSSSGGSGGSGTDGAQSLWSSSTNQLGSIVFGLLCTLVVQKFFAYDLIPYSTPPIYAWPFYLLAVHLGHFMLCRLLAAIFVCAISSSSGNGLHLLVNKKDSVAQDELGEGSVKKEDTVHLFSAAVRNLVPLYSTSPCLFAELLLVFFMRVVRYPEFVAKILIMFGGFFYCLYTDVQLFRSLLVRLSEYGEVAATVASGGKSNVSKKQFS